MITTCCWHVAAMVMVVVVRAGELVPVIAVDLDLARVESKVAAAMALVMDLEMMAMALRMVPVTAREPVSV